MQQIAGITDFSTLPGLNWQENGQLSLSGNLLRLYKKIDQKILSFIPDIIFEEQQFPPFISAEQLHKLDYLHGFPHLITMPVVLDSNQENLQAFTAAPLDENGNLNLTNVAPCREVLTPAACYHFYEERSAMDLNGPSYLTTICTCFRRESVYRPLTRQWAFSMREFVCLGTQEEVQEFLQRFEQALNSYFQKQLWPVAFEQAMDPFFNPLVNAKYVVQKLEPVKREMIYSGNVAIGSFNFHRTFFGERFNIRRQGKAIYSACVAFGLERWLYAVLATYGPQEKDWQL